MAVQGALQGEEGMNAALPPVCTHHWLLASPSGGETVAGTCKKCHEVKDFPAAGYDLRYQGQKWNQGLSNYSPNNAVDAYSLGQAMGDR